MIVLWVNFCVLFLDFGHTDRRAEIQETLNLVHHRSLKAIIIMKSEFFFVVVIFLCLLIAFPLVEGALFFKQQQQPLSPTGTSGTDESTAQQHNIRSHEQDSSSHTLSEPSSATSSSNIMHITMPQRLPQLHEEILFDVPNQADPLTLRVDRVYEHPVTRSSTVCGHILTVDTASRSSKPGGTFTLTCQAPLPSETPTPPSLSCIANLRPSNAANVQYELRPDALTKTHTLKAVARNEVYEPRVQAGDEAVHRLRHTGRQAPIGDSVKDTVTPADLSSGSVSRRLATDTNDILDLFVLWTPEAEVVAGSANAMGLYMDLVVDEANYILESSDVELRLRIVHAMRALDGRYTPSLLPAACCLLLQ